VFQNLLRNALKFSNPHRKPVIQIKAEQVFQNAILYKKIVFQDNGIGFNPAHAQKIFEVFQRLHSRDEFEGTGAGLAIVKKVVSLHNGMITADSIEGEGSLFELYFPVSL
jgi:light-regulated signal transduction histidine kinase (bacteriophytochrome)